MPNAPQCQYCGFDLDEAVRLTDKQPSCPRCANTAWVHRPRTVSRSLAISMTGLLLFVPALLYPIFTFEVVGRSNDNKMMTGVMDLWVSGAGPIAGLVLLTSVAAPLLRRRGVRVVDQQLTHRTGTERERVLAIVHRWIAARLRDLDERLVNQRRRLERVVRRLRG